jgi:hypothetical protein
MLLTAAGIGSAGGVTALVARTLFRRCTMAPSPPDRPELREAKVAACTLTDAGERP